MNPSIISTVQYRSLQADALPHFHNDYEILLVTSGEAEITVNEKAYTAKRGSIILISNYENHFVKVISQPYCRYYVIIRQAEADRLISNYSLISLLKNRPAGFFHAVDIKNSIDEAEEIFEKMIKENSNPQRYHNEYMSAFLGALLILTARSMPTEPKGAEESINQSVFKIQQYIDAHFAENIRISQLAESFFISPFYLSHTFKKQTGVSPKRYLLLARLSHARELLQETSLNVITVSERCGFTDINNFIRIFKREFSLTPQKYREKYLQ